MIPYLWSHILAGSSVSFLSVLWGFHPRDQRDQTLPVGFCLHFLFLYNIKQLPLSSKFLIVFTIYSVSFCWEKFSLKQQFIEIIMCLSLMMWEVIETAENVVENLGLNHCS